MALLNLLRSALPNVAFSNCAATALFVDIDSYISPLDCTVPEFLYSIVVEGLAALSLAANVIQFVDFGCRLFSKTRELDKSSAKSVIEHVEIKAIAQIIGRLSCALTVPPPNGPELSPEENELSSLASSCKAIANDLLTALTELELNGSRKKWQCFRIALKAVWKSEQIDGMI